LGYHYACHASLTHLTNIQGRIDLKAVQELLGHKDIKMTLRYSHLSEDFKKDAVRLLDGDLKDESGCKTYKKG
jgi:site-specific recombinase XerD